VPAAAEGAAGVRSGPAGSGCAFGAGLDAEAFVRHFRPYTDENEAEPAEFGEVGAAVLLSYTNEPVVRALGLYREQLP